VLDETAIKPLSGVKVLEMGQLIAGPFACSMLAYFGAEVIKIEPPHKGDPLRTWRELDESGTSYWWRSIGRNKKSLTLDLRLQKGRDIAKQLIQKSDVLIENFRPGTMEKWGLGPECFKQNHPSLVYTRVSGYGQTGPNASKPGFASVCEAYGGFRYINGFKDRPPVRPNLSMGDTLAGMHAVIGTLLALLAKGKLNGKGQVVDVSIYESIFNLMEAVVPEYSGTGAVREPSGSTLTGIVPTNTYLCKDSKYVVIGANGDSLFVRLMEKAQRVDLATDSRLSDNAGRVKHEAEIDDAISAWTSSLTSAQVLAELEEAVVPAGPIYSVQDMFEDEHYRSRGMIESVSYDGQDLEIPAFAPILTATPGSTTWAGPALGEHTDEILLSLMDAKNIQQLRDEGVV
jgi:crotonobetainyl-CoA:carnitine CoA-transferase CaiB-like acyl-CoA transferase